MDAIERALELLGLGPEATPEDVKQAYRDLVKVWHPDRFPNDSRLRSKAEEKLKDINEAYQTLQGYSPHSRPRTSRGPAAAGSQAAHDHGKVKPRNKTGHRHSPNLIVHRVKMEAVLLFNTFLSLRSD